MKSIIKSVFVGLCATALLLALSNSAQAQVASGSGELAVSGGWNTGWNTSQGFGTVSGSPLDPTFKASAYSFGASAGYNLSESLAVLGEFQYIPLGSTDAITYEGESVPSITFKTQLYGANLRYSYGNGKIVPYVLVGGGGASYSDSANGASSSVSGAYVDFGGGLSLYLGKNWGVRPEYRYSDLFFSESGTNFTSGVSQITGGLFFQFGGEQSSKKKASSGN